MQIRVRLFAALREFPAKFCNNLPRRFLQIVRAGAKDAQEAAMRFTPHRWNGDAQLAVQIARGQ